MRSIPRSRPSGIVKHYASTLAERSEQRNTTTFPFAHARRQENKYMQMFAYYVTQMRPLAVLGHGVALQLRALIGGQTTLGQVLLCEWLAG
jgi:hypothetical protein